MADFSQARLPHLGKSVLRLGIAGNYGLARADVAHAAGRGANFWLYGAGFKEVTPVLRELLAEDRERHVVAALPNFCWTAGMVRRSAEKVLRRLDTDYLDILLLPWLGRGSFFTQGIQDALVALKESGLVRAVGTSIHDRRRAGALARDSVLDALMVRYNAKHPGAEQDIFPHLGARDPVVISYTATSWRQLIRPIRGVEGPPLTAAECYRFVLTSPHVHVVLTAPKTREQLEANLDALEAGPLSAEEDERVRAYGRVVKARRKLPYL